MNYFIGIDSSTTATKALLMDAKGTVVEVVSSEYSYETPQPLWSEQHPHLWRDATFASIRGVLEKTGIDPAEVKGVGLTGQMHGLTLLDENGEVLRNALLWNDQRTGAECDEIREKIGLARLVEICGNDALTGFTAPKILWVKNNEPEIYAKIAKVLLPKDYVRFCLTGDFASDRAGGAGTMLFDLKARTWSEELITTLGMKMEWFPPTFEGTEITGTINEAAAKATGLLVGTPVMAGGGDQAAGAVGVGAVQEGIGMLSLGTSGVLFASAKNPVIEPSGRLHSFCHAVPDLYHMMGVILSAAGSLRWFHDTFAEEMDYDTLVNAVSSVPVGAEGLIFLPYLTGERTPHADPFARGAFVGLTVRHTFAHMTRAVLEGVAMALKDNFVLMQSAGMAKLDEIRVTGGGAKSPVWRQIIADVFGAAITSVNTTEGAAYGAALLAGVGAGEWQNVADACAATIKSVETVAPNLENAAQYDKVYEIYRKLYPALKDSFVEMSEL